MRILSLGTAYGWWGELHPDQLDNEARGQTGGGEQAWLMTALRLAARGHEVHVVGDFAAKEAYGGATFHPRTAALPLALGERWDAILAWCELGNLGRPIGFFHDLPCGDALRVVPQQLNHVLDPTDVDLIVAPSETHRVKTVVPYFTGASAAIPNGVDAARVFLSTERSRDPYAVVYASSPDRGLHHLLRAWPEIRRREPRATLRVYYEIDRWYESLRDLSTRRANPEMAFLAEEVWRRIGELRPLGLITCGARHPRSLARDFAASGVLCYPCDTVCFTEGFGQVPLEAACAGMYVLVSDQDALGEVHATHAKVIPKVELLRGLADYTLEGIDAVARCVAAGTGGWIGDAKRRRLVKKWEWSEAARQWEVLLATARHARIAA